MFLYNFCVNSEVPFMIGFSAVIAERSHMYIYRDNNVISLETKQNRAEAETENKFSYINY